MRPRLLLLLVLAIAASASHAAEHTAMTTTAVNVRAGPDRAFPTVTWLLSGTSVTVVGCIANWRWCDVIAGKDRGWVYTRYLAYPFEGSKVTIVKGGPKLALPSTEFSLGPYWDEHYRDRIWFARKAYWQARWDRRQPPPVRREPVPVNR